MNQKSENFNRMQESESFKRMQESESFNHLINDSQFYFKACVKSWDMVFDESGQFCHSFSKNLQEALEFYLKILKARYGLEPYIIEPQLKRIIIDVIVDVIAAKVGKLPTNEEITSYVNGLFPEKSIIAIPASEIAQISSNWIPQHSSKLDQDPSVEKTVNQKSENFKRMQESESFNRLINDSQFYFKACVKSWDMVFDESGQFCHSFSKNLQDALEFYLKILKARYGLEPYIIEPQLKQ